MLYNDFQGYRPFGFREDDLLSFYHIWSWRPSWSCDRLTKISFPHPMEAPNRIWLQSAMQFLRKRNFKILNLSDLAPRSINDFDL